MPRSRSSSRRPVDPARLAAFAQLGRIRDDAAYISRLADAPKGDATVQRTVLDYVAGVTRWRRWLDFLIDHYYQGDAARLEPGLRTVLQLGIYDLLYQRTPDHAALFEAVELAKQVVRPKAAGLVNGILRRVAENKPNLPKPDTGDWAEGHAIRYSHPTWMVRRWLDAFGERETRALLQANNERPAYSVRINELKTTPEAGRQVLDALEVEWTDSELQEAYVLVPRLQALRRSELLEQGLFVVQDEAAGLVVHVLDPQPGEFVIDACAAPGGKSHYAAVRMQNQGRILALDVHPKRLGLVAEGADRQGIRIIDTRVADLRTDPLPPDTPPADRLLLDVPCTGTGVLSKRADLRWRRTPEELTQLTVLQAELLDAAAPLVRSGGVLVYSTCSLEPEENQRLVASFLKRHPEYVLEPARSFVPLHLVDEAGYYATFPHRHRTDGAFAARLRKTIENP